MTYFSVIDFNLRQTSDFYHEIAYARREIGVCPINGAAAFAHVSSVRSQIQVDIQRSSSRISISFCAWLSRWAWSRLPELGSSGKCILDNEKRYWKQVNLRFKLSLDFNHEVFDRSTSLLYHAFGIVAYFYQSIHYIAGNIIVAIQEDKWRLRCPVWRSRDVQCSGKPIRRFRTVPIGRKEVFIDLPVQRVECAKCQTIR